MLSQTLTSTYLLKYVGEPAGARTQDILIKSQVLYQLSYGLAGRGRGPGLARLGQ